MLPQLSSGPVAPPAGAWSTRRTVCVLLLLVAAALAANYWAEIVWRAFDSNDPQSVPNLDFGQYYAGGHNWDLGLDPYRNHPGVPGAIQHPRMNQTWITGYIYPPTLLPIFGGLAHLSYQSARTVWLWCNLAAFALLLLVAVVVDRGRRLEVATAAVLLTMVSFPFYWHVRYGQIDMIVASLSICGFLLYPRWKGWPSAALLALAVAAKVSPVVILLTIVVYYRDWRFLLKTLACGAVVLGASLLVVDWSLFVEYVSKILPAISGSDPDTYNQTPLRFWSRFPGVVRAASLLGYAALVFLAWIAGRNSRRLTQQERLVDTRTEKYALLLLAVLMMLFFSPLAWQQAYVWPIVPLALLLVARPPRGQRWGVLLLGAAAALLSLRAVHLQVLNMPNIIGAGMGILTLMWFYLPLDLKRLRATNEGLVTASMTGDAQGGQVGPGDDRAATSPRPAPAEGPAVDAEGSVA